MAEENNSPVKGDVVMIYHDPITKKHEEGLARLETKYRPDEGDGLEIWVVEFLSDHFVTVRTIQK